MARHHLDPFTVSFAEPRSKMQPQQGSIRKAPTRSILANVESDDVLAKRSANPISTCPEAGLQRADRQEQERLIKAYRAERHRLWVSQQDEQMASARYPKRALHLLVVEALGYHRQRQTSELNRKLAASIAMKHPAGIPAVLRVDPKGSSLSREVVQQIFDDVDWLVDHYGREMGMRALEQMFLWDTAPRPPSSSRTVPPKAAAPTL